MEVKQLTNSADKTSTYVNNKGRCWAIEGAEGRNEYRSLKGVAKRFTSLAIIWREDSGHHYNITTVIPQEYMEFT